MQKMWEKFHPNSSSFHLQKSTRGGLKREFEGLDFVPRRPQKQPRKSPRRRDVRTFSLDHFFEAIQGFQGVGCRILLRRWAAITDRVSTKLLLDAHFFGGKIKFFRLRKIMVLNGIGLRISVCAVFAVKTLQIIDFLR